VVEKAGRGARWGGGGNQPARAEGWNRVSIPIKSNGVTLSCVKDVSFFVIKLDGQREEEVPPAEGGPIGGEKQYGNASTRGKGG